MVFDILSDLLKINEVLLIIRNNGAISETKSNSLHIKQKGKWITIGDSEGPSHMHINVELIKCVEFVKENRNDHTSFSVRFFDQNGDRILGAFFTKMYDQNNTLNFERMQTYEKLCQKYGSKIRF